MKKRWIEINSRERRHLVIRKKVEGTKDRPRLSVYRSLNHMYAQLIDDTTGVTLAALSTASPTLKDALKGSAGNVKGAAMLGEALAAFCKTKGIAKVVFDRSGYLYHGRVKALAEAARKGGLVF